MKKSKRHTLDFIYTSKIPGEDERTFCYIITDIISAHTAVCKRHEEMPTGVYIITWNKDTIKFSSEMTVDFTIACYLVAGSVNEANYFRHVLTKSLVDLTCLTSLIKLC